MTPETSQLTELNHNAHRMPLLEAAIERNLQLYRDWETDRKSVV